MSIRLIAKDLYRLEKEVEHLEKALMEATREKRSTLEAELRKTTAERNRLRRILEGSKEDPPCRRPV